MVLYAVKLKIKGKVQDVSFRSFTKRNAELLELKGFVKNMDDGSVEAFAEGDKNNIEVFIEAMRSGPDRAIVKNVEIEWKKYSGIYNDFKMIY